MTVTLNSNLIPLRQLKRQSTYDIFPRKTHTSIRPIKQVTHNKRMIIDIIIMTLRVCTGDIVKKPTVGCHYFPPGPRLPSQPQNITVVWPVTNYTAGWQRHRTVTITIKMNTINCLSLTLHTHAVELLSRSTNWKISDSFCRWSALCGNMPNKLVSNSFQQ